MDRQVLGVLKTTLQHDLGWNEIEYSNLVSAFQAAYAVGMLVVGWLVDRLGARAGYAIAMVFWSLASMGHAIGNSLGSFVVARSALGFWEAGVFPASIKAVADWFPKQERALATGIFNAGTSAGAMATPLIVPWITIHWGWRWAFLTTGALGLIWLVFWLLLYHKPEDEPYVTKEELDYIRSGSPQPGETIKWRRLLPLRQTWAFATGKFMLDPHLVVLPFLGTRFSPTETWTGFDENRTTRPDDLPHLRCGQHWWRLAFLHDDSTWNQH